MKKPDNLKPRAYLVELFHIQGALLNQKTTIELLQSYLFSIKKIFTIINKVQTIHLKIHTVRSEGETVLKTSGDQTKIIWKLFLIYLLCVGNFTACKGKNDSLKHTSEQKITFNSAGINYRISQSTDSQFIAYCDFLKDESQISSSDITDIEITDEKGNVLPVKEQSFFSSSNSFRHTNNKVEDQKSLLKNSGYFLKIDSSFMRNGYYTFHAKTLNGKTITYSFYFCGESSIYRGEKKNPSQCNYLWHQNNALELTWETPSELYDKIQISISDEYNNELLRFELPATSNNIIIPPEVMQNIKETQNPSLLDIFFEAISNSDDNEDTAVYESRIMIEFADMKDQKIEFKSANLYFQTKDYDFSVYKGYNGYCKFIRKNSFISEPDIKRIRLKDSSGHLVSTATFDDISINRNDYIAEYNEEDSTISISENTNEDELNLHICFNNITKPLEQGFYTFEAETRNGKILTQTVFFEGEEELPYHDSNLISDNSNDDKSLTLNWENPAGSYDEIFISIDSYKKLIIKVPANLESITIPDEILQKVSLSRADLFVITFQTRKYSKDAHCYSVGDSRGKRIFPTIYIEHTQPIFDTSFIYDPIIIYNYNNLKNSINITYESNRGGYNNYKDSTGIEIFPH